MSSTIRTDVTAVKLIRNFVVAGIGSFINIFDKESTMLLNRIQCLNGQKIYGFVDSSCGKKIIVFGGKQFTTVTVGLSLSETGAEFSRDFAPVACNDWIHSAVWTGDTVALLTAHNVVQKWDIMKKTLKSRHPSPDNSILYSGLLWPVEDDLLVFAGTVFSEVIIHRCGADTAFHNLKGHKGVIFSIASKPEKNIIVTTSDDRSVRIWYVSNKENLFWNTMTYWEKSDITCAYEVYGHTARVMRSFITDDLVISVGEDAGICYWDHQGSLQRRVTCHQTACIWALDADSEHLVTGGGDSGVILHSLSKPSDYSNKELLDISGTPKRIVFSARRNVVILNEDAELIYYNVSENNKIVHKLSQELTFILLAISSCKQIIAVVDMKGKLNVFIESCQGEANLVCVVDTKFNFGKLQSMHWAGNRHLVFCSDDGDITVLAAKGTEVELYDKYTIPACKERWLTAAAIDLAHNIIICGDRCGNIHLFVKGLKNPVKTFKKVHGRYGPTSITVRNDEIVTTGRDRTIQCFEIDYDLAKSKYLSSKELEFKWVEKFLDKNETMICGFQERTFVVFDVKTNTKIIAANCGGGHRPWDAVRYFEKVNDKIEEFIKLIYLKHSETIAVTFELGMIIAKNIVHGSQSKEINCLKSYKTDLDSSLTFYISGGEDTTLRVSSLNSDYHFQDEIIFKQLSNIRTLKVYPLNGNQLLVISAGGRAQICVSAYRFADENGVKVTSQELADFMLKGSGDKKKKNKGDTTDDFDPETRIMDVDAIKLNENKFLVFAGCSDVYLRVFMFDMTVQNEKLKLLKEIKHHKTCILKTQCINFLGNNILVTCTTRGEINFWHVDKQDINTLKPFFVVLANKSGINSFAYKVIGNRLLIATGGDDNAICLTLLETDICQDCEENRDNLSMKVVGQLCVSNFHCSQITGLILLDDIMVSTSIDQRITVSDWKVDGNGISCDFRTQVYSDVADIQGLDLLEYDSDSVTVCVFGKGLEVIKINISKQE